MRLPFLPITTFVLTCGLSTLIPTHSFGQTTFNNGYGLSASVFTASDCPSFCTGDFDRDSGGGEFADFASATNTLYGISRARAFYNGSETFLPQLQAFSSSPAGRGGGATAFGVQGFAYEGAAPRSITIDFGLDANVLDSGSFGSESASASIGVLGVGGLALNGAGEANLEAAVNGPDYIADFGTWYFENFGTRLGNDSIFVNSPNGSDTGSITFDVDPGDVFFVGASLSASSRTGTADAFNTFTSSFADPTIETQLSIANPVAAIPEPGGAAFLSLVTIGWAAGRRRRSSFSANA